MTVAEMIEALKQFPPDMRFVVYGNTKFEEILAADRVICVEFVWDESQECWTYQDGDFAPAGGEVEKVVMVVGPPDSRLR